MIGFPYRCSGQGRSSRLRSVSNISTVNNTPLGSALNSSASNIVRTVSASSAPAAISENAGFEDAVGLDHAVVVKGRSFGTRARDPERQQRGSG